MLYRRLPRLSAAASASLLLGLCHASGAHAAAAYQIDSPDVLFTGSYADGQLNDLMIENERVAVREKDSPCIGPCPRGLLDLRSEFVPGFSSEALLLVHVAETASVVRATDRRLENQRIGLRRRPNHRFVVMDVERLV